MTFNNVAGVPGGGYGLEQCKKGCGTWLYPHMFHRCSKRGSVTVDGFGRIYLSDPDGHYWEESDG